MCDARQTEMARLEPSAERLPTSAMAALWRRVADMWGLSAQARPHDPTSNPVALTDDNVDCLTREEFVVAEKTNGVRYMLVLCELGGRQQSIMLDRAMRGWIVALSAPASYFRGSLFCGELVWDHRAQHAVYYAFDCVFCVGEAMRARPYDARMAATERAFGTGGRVATEGDAPVLRAKPYAPARELARVHAESRALPHDCDGLIFTCMRDGVVRGANRNMFKWKPTHTVDLELRLARVDSARTCTAPTVRAADGAIWAYALFYQQLQPASKGVELTLPLANACEGIDWRGRRARFCLRPNAGLERLLTQLSARSKADLRSIVELEANFAEETGGGASALERVVACGLVQLRADKHVPNTLSVVRDVLQCIERPLSIERLIARATARRQAEADGAAEIKQHRRAEPSHAQIEPALRESKGQHTQAPAQSGHAREGVPSYEYFVRFHRSVSPLLVEADALAPRIIDPPLPDK